MSWFSDRAEKSLRQSLAILEQRGEEYADSWGNPITIYLDAALREIPAPSTPAEKRIIALASLCDVKLSRIRGGEFKADNSYDNINYEGAFVEAMNEYLSASELGPRQYDNFEGALRDVKAGRVSRLRLSDEEVAA